MIHFDAIFLVDDDPVNNLINKRLLGKVGTSKDIHEFLEGEEALKALNNFPESSSLLIFLDINMPVLNGWGFLKKYEKSFIHRKDKIVILSSSIDYQDKGRAKTYSTVSGFVEKPLTIDKIKIYLNEQS